MLKNLVKDLKPSSTLLINETSRKLEEQGRKIYKFGFGQSPFKVPEDVVKELKDNAHQNKYLPMQGLSELRNAVAKYTSKKKNYDYNSCPIQSTRSAPKQAAARHLVPRAAYCTQIKASEGQVRLWEQPPQGYQSCLRLETRRRDLAGVDAGL